MTRRALVLMVLVAAVVPVAAGAPLKPPETTITSGPPDPVASNSATFSFSSNAEEPKFACALDSQVFKTCTSPKVYTNLADGLHTFFVFATKDRVSDPTPASWTWTIDTIPPQPIAPSEAVRYRQLTLSWAPPASVGADHVVVLRSTSPKQEPSVQVYTGAGTSYAESKFDNAAYHSYRIIGVDRAGNASHGADVVVAASALLLAPADGSRVAGRPPALVWRGVPSARYYNVQLWRAGKKILSAWPASPRLQLAKKWSYRGHRQRLKTGSYTWFVWPGFGPRAKGSYGQLVGRSSFQVAA